MKDLSKEILAYALQNAIEHGKAESSRILPKLFQHGLEKSEIKEVMPIIQETVSKVNEMDEQQRKMRFGKVDDLVIKREHNEKKLEDLPEVSKKMVFRLAPFPSGALHIGNAKTYVLNALYAEKYKGKIILVMDDTIGSSEKPLTPEAYELIEDAFKWLGIDYEKKIVYKSDRLKIYYKYCEELIKKNKAYVCHCSQDELRENRAKGIECSCRQFPPGIQIARWKEMFKMKEGHAVVRIKTSMIDPNPAFRDRVLFKISDREHPRVGNKYRVWPSLEMSWAIDDHDLGITHIIRGNDLVMETQMEKFIWDIFRWKHPVTIHTGLVRIEGVGAKVSKSKARKEVLSGEFIGWDDPRTWSIQSLARRGITPQAIREFVKEIGLNKQDIAIPIESLYALNRRLIDLDANRYYFVKNPVKIKIEGTQRIEDVEVPVHPEKKETRKVNASVNIFVSKEDFEKNLKKEVRLLHLLNVKLDEKSKITSIENKKIPKIQWVADEISAKILMSDGKWISGYAEENVNNLKKGEMIQFERFGFCRYDREHEGVKEFWFAHK